MNAATEHYDVIVIGSGAGGAATTYRLARAGCNVLLIEKGERLPRDQSTLDVRRVMALGEFRNREYWTDGRGNRFVPEEYYALGGKTKWYGAALLRFAPEEFAPDTDFACFGWPIDYEDMAPYYAEAEALLAVREFAHEPQLARLIRRIAAKNECWQVSTLPMGLSPKILEYEHEARHFDGFASALDLKSDAEVSLLSRVEHLPNVRIVTSLEVVNLTGTADRATGVACNDGRRFQADVVVLAAGALNSPRLLQRYVGNTGIADWLPGARLIGRYYKCHLNSPMLAFSITRNTDTLRKTALFLNKRFPHSSIQTLGWIDGEILATQLPAAVPSRVTSLLAAHAFGFWLTTEDGSNAENRVCDASPNGKTPMLDYDVARLPASMKEHRNLTRSFRAALRRVGLLAFARPVGLSGTAHACGTLLAGRDPATSVVDVYGRVHGLPNLYVADASVFPRSARVNPSLSIYAWGLRLADSLMMVSDRTLMRLGT